MKFGIQHLGWVRVLTVECGHMDMMCLCLGEAGMGSGFVRGQAGGVLV